MSEYAPDALWWLGRQIVAVFGGSISGIVGDVLHHYGYHRCRNVLPDTDYSVQFEADKEGDGWAASALDVTLSPGTMPVVTKRLLDSAKDRNDPRLNVVREFFGTLDGVNVTGWDCVKYSPSTSDSSHLWHIHLSVLRKYSNDQAALEPVLAVIRGEPYISPEDDVAGGFPAFDIRPEGQHTSVTTWPVNSGDAGHGQAWLDFCNDTDNQDYAVRVYYTLGDGAYHPLVERQVVKSGKVFELFLPTGTRGVTVNRVSVDGKAPVYGGHLTGAVQYGKRV